MNKYSAKYLVSLGWRGIAVAMLVSTRSTDLQMSFSSAAVLRIYQSAPLAFLFIPVTLVAYAGLPADKSNAAAGLVNFMRNMGGSIGTSIVATVIARRSQFHQAILTEHTRSPRFQVAAAGLTIRLNHAGIGYADAQTNAVARLARMLRAQAAVLSYIDLHWILAIAGAVMFVGGSGGQRTVGGR